MNLIVFSFAKAVPAALFFFVLVYLSLRKKMGSRSVPRSLVSLMLTLLACGALNYFLATVTQDPNDVVTAGYLNIASFVVPLLMSAMIVWVVHVGLAKKLA